MKRYTFFLRHFNDIDNISPAIFFLLNKHDNYQVNVILYDATYNHDNDPNLVFLKEQFPTRFTYNWIGEYYGIEFEITESKIQRRNQLKNVKKSIKLLFKKSFVPVDFFLNITRSIRFKSKGISSSTTVDLKSILNGDERDSVIQKGIKKIFNDHGDPNLVIFCITRSNAIKGLLNNLRLLGVKKIICLPVSPLINYNVLREERFVDVYSSFFHNSHDYSGFDALGYVDDSYVNEYNKIIPLTGKASDLIEKTEYLGSIRFCPEWLPIRENMITPYLKAVAKGKIKVAFFPSLPKSNVNWDEVERTYQMISLFPQYEVIVKSHTRSDVVEKFSLNKNSNLEFDDLKYSNIKFESSIDSSALINWADVIIFWSSSVAIEGYKKNKCMVCLSYIVANKNLYQKFNAGYIAECRDDLFYFLSNYSSNKELIKYNDDGVKNLMSKLIYLDKKTVPQRYINFMKKYEFKI